MVRRCEFYFPVVKQQVSKILFFFTTKIKFTSLNRRVISFLLYRQECFCRNISVKVGNDVIDILTSEDMENMPLESRM